MSTNNAALSAFCLMVSVHAASLLHAQTNFYDHVTRLWLNGQKQEVYCIATNRLAANSNDITGLVLKMEYELEFSLLDEYTNTLWKSLIVSRSVCTTNFAQLRPLLEAEGVAMQNFVSTYPTNTIEADKLKGSITNKPMTYKRLIHAIETDGLLNN